MFFGYETFYELTTEDYINSDYIEIMFWINIPITIVVMFFVTLFVRKWKRVPEE